ncbi:S41 family peptidase [uncultured Massilia sp.]|uniref:S41 family peptidase n=1 Tax=uncultured Massilia sp. TaxID=169973 RepID=UPI0025CCBAE1|nr:S41 family peptidase [uncultured Massilia sp.]
MRMTMRWKLTRGAAAAVALSLACLPGARAVTAATAPQAPQAQAGPAPIALPDAQVEKLLAAYALIKHNYVGQTDDEALFEGALSGMLASLDPHSRYLDKEAMLDMQRADAGEYVGIGIEVEDDRDQLRVVAVAEGSPAERAGIAGGDVIASVDGVATIGQAREDVARRMRGTPGSTVTVGVVHGGRQRVLRIARAALHDATVRTRMAAPGLAWIRITEFGGATGADLAAALAGLDGKAPPRAVVLDLRNDPGGLVAAAVAVAGAFLPPGSVVFTARGREGGGTATVTADPRYYRAPNEADVLAGLPAWTRTVPLAVLVNGASASSAELVAGALQDHGRATVIGTQTFGKGSIQSVIPLGADDGIKFTVARYFTPGGHAIQAQGVTPDIVVAPTAGADAGLLVREADLARHLPAATAAVPAPGSATATATATATAAATAEPQAPRSPVESTRTFGTGDDKALQAAVALFAPAPRRTPTLAGLLGKWSARLKPGLAGTASAP